jgi:6-phosphogluconolactonase
VTRPHAALWVLLAAGCAGGAGGARGPSAAGGQGKEATHVYVGGSAGEVSIFTVDRISGHLEARGTASARSTALAADPAGRFLYAASESGDLLAFAIRAGTGALASLGRASARGTGTSSLAVHRTGKYLLAANGGSGTVSVLPIKPDGSLFSAEVYPSGAGPQAVGPHPQGEAVFVLNSAARTIGQFAFNTGTGILTAARVPPVGLPPRSVPRRIAFHPSGRFIYILQEDGTIAGYGYEATSATLAGLAFQILSTVPPGGKAVKGRGGDLEIHPAGRALYTVDRGHDEVNIYSIDAETGALALAGHQPTGGRQPRALSLAGGVLVVAHQGSSNLASFLVDPQTGALTSAGTTPLRSSPLSLVAVTSRER